jgi:hypothetical protein
MDLLNHKEEDMVFYQVFLVSVRNCKRLREFEKIEISSKAVEVTVNNKEENCKAVVWISSKNSASGRSCSAWQKSQSTYRVEMKQGECICSLSRSVHCNFVRDCRLSSEWWRACTPDPHDPGLIFPS